LLLVANHFLNVWISVSDHVIDSFHFAINRTYTFAKQFIATGAVRIGMNDIEELGVYVWEDGSDVTHIRWAPGDPNNSGGSERCIGMMRTNGGFFVILCDGPYKDFLFCETNYDSIYS
jgi:hypothetical protein